MTQFHSSFLTACGLLAFTALLAAPACAQEQDSIQKTASQKTASQGTDSRGTDSTYETSASEATARDTSAGEEGKALMMQARDALGGEAFDQVRSLRTIGRQNGREHTTTIELPDKLHVELGRRTIVSDGQRAEIRRGARSRVLSPQERRQIEGDLWQSVPYLMARLRHEDLSLRARGDTTMKGHRYKAVRVIPPVGNAFTVCLSAESMRPERLFYTETGPQSQETTNVTETFVMETFSDFRQARGMILPFESKVVRSADGEQTIGGRKTKERKTREQEITAQVTERIEVNVDPKENLFVPEASSSR